MERGGGVQLLRFGIKVKEINEKTRIKRRIKEKTWQNAASTKAAKRKKEEIIEGR